MDGLTLTFSRELTDHVLRHHELFSSVGGIDLGNIRPLIPLNVDPPEHSKYRKILDPLFAPKQMDAQEADITERVNHFIDAFADRGECNFTEEFAELLPSSVFLGLMGLPWDELDTFLHLRDGILRPAQDRSRRDVRRRRRAWPCMRATGREIYAYFDKVCDERVAAPDRRHPLAPRHRRDRRREAHARGDPRHLLPVPHRRPRHGERLAHVLLRVPREPSRAPAPARRRPGAHPGRGRGAAALGVAGAERRAAHRDPGHRAAERHARSRRAPR